VGIFGSRVHRQKLVTIDDFFPVLRRLLLLQIFENFGISNKQAAL